LTTALDNDYTSANNDAARTTTFANDLEFVTFANNGGATTTQSTEIGGSSLPGAPEFNTRPTREWQVQNPDGILGLNLKFEGFGGYDLIASTDDNFGTLGDNVIIGTLDANGEISGVNLADGAYFTVAKFVQAPGGVSTDLGLWLKADAGGDSWTDQSTNNINVTAQGTPSNSTTAYNFNSAVNFVRSNDDQYLVNDQTVMNGTDSFSIIMVMQPNALANRILGEDGNTSSHGFLFFQGNSVGLHRRGTGNLIDGGTTNLKDGNLHISVIQRSGNNFTTYADGLMQASTTRTEALATYSNYLLGEDGGSAGFDGDMAEVILYKSDVSGTEKQQLESYLALKYGISLDQTVATNYFWFRPTCIKISKRRSYFSACYR